MPHKHHWGWEGIALAAVVAVWLPISVLSESLPFVETFESRAQGVLDSQGDWLGLPSTNVQVLTGAAFAGERAVIVGKNSMMQTTFDGPGATNVWVDFYTRVEPRAFTLQPRLRYDSVAGFYFNTSGNIVAWSNDTWVTLSNVALPPNTWHRLSINLDYSLREWSIYVADDQPNTFAIPVATNLAFNSAVANPHFTKFSIRN